MCSHAALITVHTMSWDDYTSVGMCSRHAFSDRLLGVGAGAVKDVMTDNAAIRCDVTIHAMSS